MGIGVRQETAENRDTENEILIHRGLSMERGWRYEAVPSWR